MCNFTARNYQTDIKNQNNNKYELFTFRQDVDDELGRFAA